jgi:N-acyl-D-aspartate/D-glutamate deacylase
MTVEQAVYRLTAQPADMFGIKDRGRLKVGHAADIVVFDAATIGSSDQPTRQFDLPGGGKRMIVQSRGVDRTIVNGQTIWADGTLTGAMPGTVLRS